MSAIGNLNDYVKYQMAQGMAQPGAGGGVAGSAAEIAMGFAHGPSDGESARRRPGWRPAGRSGADAPPLPDVLTPADVAKVARRHRGRRARPRSRSGDLKGRKIGSAWRVTKAALDDFLKHRDVAPVALNRPRCPGDRHRCRHCPTGRRRAGGGGARQAPLPGLRRRGQLERRQAGAGLSLLRHRVASGTGQRRHARQGARPRPGAARHPRQRPRLGARSDAGAVPELQGHLAVRIHPGGAALRVLRLAGGRAVHDDPQRHLPREPAAVHGQRGAGARVDPRAGTPAAGSRPTG